MSMNGLCQYLKRRKKYHNGTVIHDIVTKLPYEEIKLRQNFTENKHVCSFDRLVRADVLIAFHSDKRYLYQASESCKPSVNCFTETYSIFFQHVFQQDIQDRLRRVQFHISCEWWSCILEGRSLHLLNMQVRRISLRSLLEIHTKMFTISSSFPTFTLVLNKANSFRWDPNQTVTGERKSSLPVYDRKT